MEIFNSIPGNLGSSSEIKNPFFTFNSKTIKFNHGDEVYPVSNLTKIGVYNVKEEKIPIIVILISGIAALGFIFSGVGLLIVPGFFVAAFTAFSIYQRMKPGRYAFGFTTASSEERYILSTDKKFISKVINTLTYVIENEEENPRYSINMENVEIKDLNAEKVIDKSVKNEGVIGGRVAT